MFIDSEWNLQHILLDVTPLDGTHSGQNLRKAFTDLLEDFGITKKLLALTMDNATNMDTLCSDLARFLATLVIIIFYVKSFLTNLLLGN